jgi:hypothetical protein
LNLCCYILSYSKLLMSVLLTSTKKYPDTLFNPLNFIEENRNILRKFNRNNILEIDLSNDISVTSRDIKLILHNLKFLAYNIDKIALNVAYTSVNALIFEILKEETCVKQINICGTAAVNSELLDDEDNILSFMMTCDLIFLLEEDIEDCGLDSYIVQKHRNYYCALL